MGKNNIIKNLSKSIKSNKGNAYPLAIAVILILLILLLTISEYFRLNIIAKGIKDALQDAVISAVTENYDNVYHGTREGYSGAYMPNGSSFSASLDYGDIYDRLDNNLGLIRSGDKHIKYNGGEIEFYINGLDVKIQNAPYTKDDNAQRFKIESYVNVYVPIPFVDRVLPPMRLKLKTTAGYTPIF